MARPWRVPLERLEAEHKKQLEWEQTHPPITRLSVEAADAKRTIQPVGEQAVTCNLPCHGDNIPGQYSHIGGLINVFDRKIMVSGYYDSRMGEALYAGLTCESAGGKICVARDELLRESAERRSVER